jgi:hypothetical protein
MFPQPPMAVKLLFVCVGESTDSVQLGITSHISPHSIISFYSALHPNIMPSVKANYAVQGETCITSLAPFLNRCSVCYMTYKITFRQYVVAVLTTALTLTVVSPAGAESPAVLEEGIPAACLSLTDTLRFGSTDATTGGEVTKLQNYIGVVPATGYFGPLTQAAVEQWQILNEIVMNGTPDTTGFGVVGPRSRAVLAAGCPGNETSSSLSPQADFYFDAAQAPAIAHTDEDCDFAGPNCGTLTLRGTAQNVGAIEIVNLEIGTDDSTPDVTPWSSIAYNPQTDSYAGSIDYARVRSYDAEDTCPCYHPITFENPQGIVHWEKNVTVNTGGKGNPQRFAIFDATTKLLLDYIEFNPEALVSVQTDNGRLSGSRINGTAEVPELVVRVVDTRATSGEETVYTSEPIDVKGGRWWHRIGVPLTAQLYYSIFLETPDGTPLFEGTYESE